MPELPEVETVRRTLEPHVAGQTISRVQLLRPAQIRFPDPETFAEKLRGAQFAAQVLRKGKYLLLPLVDGGTLICHLRMSGRLYVARPAVERLPHTHVIFHLDNGLELRYVDQRTFGGFHLVHPDGTGMPAGLGALGPEPAAPEWTGEYLMRQAAGRKASIKALLLDQSVVAGLGNIYVDETLFRAGVGPRRPAGDVSAAELGRIAATAQTVLERAIEYRGTTFSLYLDGEGRAGEYYKELQVFDRTGLPCVVCGTPIVKERVAGRGTHFCPRCQH